MSYTVLFASDETGAGDAAFRIIQNGFEKIGIQITQRKMDNDAVQPRSWATTTPTTSSTWRCGTGSR